MIKEPLMLIILDGLGIGREYPGNAVYLADTPVLDKIKKEHPFTKIEASGKYVGLPEGQMGNSEVGHLNIGAGKIIYQELTNISKSIEDGSFYEKKELLEAIENAKRNNSKIHLIGLLSEGGVHSHISHLYGLLELMKKENFEDVYIHCILDGRDVSPTVGIEDLEKLQNKMEELNVGKIASVSGRYYAMDRDNRWERIEKAYNVCTRGYGNESNDPMKLVKESYKKGITDEFIIPTVIKNGEEPVSLIEENDSVIFFNFRPDRARQVTRAFVDEDFHGFERVKIDNLYFVTLTEYDKTIENTNIVFKPDQPDNTLGEIISKNGLTQLRAAETEKYAHVTFFLNGGREEPFENEDRLLVPSPKVATYDLQPEMNAMELKDRVIEKLNKDKYDFIILNFANCDMVGHTGDIKATIRAVETVDKALGEILSALEAKGGKALITADHGNAEKLLDYEDNSIFTAHTTNPVPLIYYGGKKDLRDGGKLADLGPTILEVLEIEKPEKMTGKSLLKNQEE